MSAGGSQGRLRIAAHNGAPEFGGAEIATAILLQGLRERGHEVVLFYNRDVVAEGVRRYGLDVRRAHLGGDVAVHHSLRFAAQLRRFRPDVLIVGTFRKLWLAALAARLASVPTTVARIGLSTDLPRSAKYRFTYRRLVDLVVVNADDLRDAYLAALPAAPPPRVVTIHKGVAPSPPGRSPAAVRKELGVPADAPLVGGVGRLVEQKRFDRLLRAFARLPADTYCVIVGGGVLQGELEALARDLDVAGRVRFAGHRDDVVDLMAALDLLVVSSDRESLANVMLEALAAGVPVISTDVSGAREALKTVASVGSAPGRVVEADAMSLAEAVSSALEDRVALAAMAAAAREAANERFGRERMLDQWEAALRAVPGHRQGGR